MEEVSIQGHPAQIPNRSPYNFASLVVPGPVFAGKGDYTQPNEPFCLVSPFDTLAQSYGSII